MTIYGLKNAHIFILRDITFLYYWGIVYQGWQEECRRELSSSSYESKGRKQAKVLQNISIDGHFFDFKR